MQINPLPYLIMEFVTANTYSMLLPIGNPTNIYLSTYFHISFHEYISHMFFPTIVAGLVSFCVLLLLFHQHLKVKMTISYHEEIKIEHKNLLFIALIHLGVCLILLCIADFLHIEMYILSSIIAISLFLFLIIFSIFTKNRNELKNCFHKLPFTLIPFLLSMFVLVLSLNNAGIFNKISHYYEQISNSFHLRFHYGIGGLFVANILNNIPMSLAYSFIIHDIPLNSFSTNVFPSIIASNIGAYFTPIGSLAGMMWMDILKHKNVSYGFKDFLKYGSILAPITLLFSLLFL